MELFGTGLDLSGRASTSCVRTLEGNNSLSNRTGKFRGCQSKNVSISSVFNFPVNSFLITKMFDRKAVLFIGRFWLEDYIHTLLKLTMSYSGSEQLEKTTKLTTLSPLF